MPLKSFSVRLRYHIEICFPGSAFSLANSLIQTCNRIPDPIALGPGIAHDPQSHSCRQSLIDLLSQAFFSPHKSFLCTNLFSSHKPFPSYEPSHHTNFSRTSPPSHKPFLSQAFSSSHEFSPRTSFSPHESFLFTQAFPPSHKPSLHTSLLRTRAFFFAHKLFPRSQV